jgi:O-methyltransferase
MGMKLNIIRKTKWNLIRFRFHWLVEPFSGMLLNLAYLSKVSKWVSLQKEIPYNDFYSGKWNYEKRYGLYEFVLGHKKLRDEEMIYLEFGVYGGSSFKWWLGHNTHPQSRFIGFDTFEGLPEDWGIFKRGDMSSGLKMPDVDDPRASFVKGLFQQTLPEVLKTVGREKRKVIMMDADLYTSTLYVLTTVAPFLAKGDVILFDQFNVPRHEFLAFTNFVESHYIRLQLIGAANNYYFCAFEVC